MLKVIRWLVLSTVLLVGCGLLPTAAPLSPTTAPAGSSESPAGGPTAGTTVAPSAPSPPASPSPRPSPSPSPSPTPIPLTTLKLGTSASLGGWILDVAEQQGYLAAQGIEFDRAEADHGSVALAEGVEKREHDIGVVTTDRLVQVGENGQSLIMVAGLVNEATFALIAARDVPDFSVLKGKPIGHLDAKGASAALLRPILQVKGIPENEELLITFPDPGVVGAAVANGTVAASLVDAPRAGRLRGSGFQVLVEASDEVKDFQTEGLVVRPDWARQNEDLLVRVIRATILAERWVTTPANKGAAVEQLARSLDLTSTEARIVYEQYVEKVQAIPREGDIDQAGVRSVIELLAEIDAAGDPPPDAARLADTTYLQRAKSSLPR